MLWAIMGLYFVLLLILAALFLLRHSLPSYFSEKGKNLATKQDIAAITDEVEKTRKIYIEQLEEIQQQNRLILEDFKSRNQLRLAALDKRLEVHQQAYTLWRKVTRCAEKENEARSALDECQDWWDRNCLYLTADAREAFWKSFTAAQIHLGFKAGPMPQAVEKIWHTILRAGEVLVRGVSLPPIDSENEADFIKGFEPTKR